MSNTAKILEQYDETEERLKRFEDKTRILLEETIEESKLSIHSVQSRTKARDSLKNKCDRPNKNYQKLADVTDAVAFRIITYFEDDVDRVGEVLREHFKVDLDRSVDKRDRKATEFGYTALHYICQYKADREGLVDNRPYIGLCWEVQICSVLQHAWNEIEHDIGYKSQDQVPTDITRRLHRLSGTLELVDSEFREIRNKTDNYRKAIALRIETKDKDVSDVGLDTISLATFVEQDLLVRNADNRIAKEFLRQRDGSFDKKTLDVILAGLRALGINTLQSLREKLEANEHYLPEFLQRATNNLKIAGNLSDFTVRKGFSVNLLMTFLLAEKGVSELAKVYQATGAFGTQGEAIANAYAKAIWRA